MFDVATLWTVTEHLPDNSKVIKGVFDYLEPGQLLCLSHHNYYSYDGHHVAPNTPSQYDPSNTAHRHVANWQHLEPSSTAVYNKRSLNRVRLGDLVALVRTYFRCSWTAVSSHGARKALVPKLLKKLQARGFVKTELLVTRWDAKCKRRDKALDAAWLPSAVLYHPPTDGSYAPQLLPPAMIRQLDTMATKAAHYRDTIDEEART
mmetsp:Transcript_53674/g.149323  ORF Transcript_53674/g.149323 Transcript_53674/m.149323 type:complete len:205 (+) Transcript_53674:1-615(+)